MREREKKEKKNDKEKKNKKEKNAKKKNLYIIIFFFTLFFFILMSNSLQHFNFIRLLIIISKHNNIINLKDHLNNLSSKLDLLLLTNKSFNN